MIEYAAIVLLIAAILSVVMDLRMADRIAALLQHSMDSVAGPQADGDEDGSPPPLAGGAADTDTGTGSQTGTEGTGAPGAFPEEATDPEDEAAGAENALWEGDSPVYGSVFGGTPPDGGLHLAPGEDGMPEPVGEINPDDPVVERFLDALLTAAAGDMAGAVQGLWALVTDAPQAIAGFAQAVMEDPWGLLVSKEFRQAFSEGDWALVLGYGLWEFGSLLSLGAGIVIKMIKTLGKIPDGGKLPGTPDTPPDKGGGSDQNGEGGKGKDGESEEGDKDGITCASNSFLPGTPVLLADGSTAPIEDITADDEVWAFDPLTGEEGPREVTATIAGDGPKALVDITTDDGSGNTGTVTATDEHPFWAPEPARWVDAIDLQPGTWLRTSAGTWTQVTATEVHRADDQQVHNLTVDDLSTYYASTGSVSLLTHNDSSDCSDLGEDWEPRDPGEICGSSGCEDVARDIQSRIGGTRYRIQDSLGAPFLGQYRGEDTGWGHHDVVIKDGRVYDAFSSRHGVPIEEYRNLWQYGDDLEFTELKD
ncbi:polymorphic toxin-type HINT domain-containing protein [Nocardiopsis sp. CNT-189]|uniref:polymorphic toxin-type HINT domain-containing protein n=1 Tax=Nocardiopsis oceanisediminis TaxID=2816862 RepID=UPI003B3B49CC